MNTNHRYDWFKLKLNMHAKFHLMSTNILIKSEYSENNSIPEVRRIMA